MAIGKELLIQLHTDNMTSDLGHPYQAFFMTTVSSSGNASGNLTDPNSTLNTVATPIWVLVLKTAAMVAIMFMAVAGNILVITSVLKFEKLRIIANFFIVSLAFADLLVAILVMPFSASQEIAGKWVFGKVMCDIFNANDVLFSTASLLHLCCISMDRYIAITDPFHYESKMTKRRVCIMLMCAWGASALISHIPIHMGWYTTSEQKETMESDVESCQFVVNKPYAVVSSFISFWTPTIIMVFTYVKIFREARRQEKQIYLLTKQSPQSLEHLASNHVNGGVETNGNGTAGPQNPTKRLTQDRKKMRREHKAAKTLGVIMGCFIFCWLPFFLWYLTSTLCDSCYSPPIVVSTLFWIGYLNSGLNPIIYAFFNRDFRFAFKRLLRCHRLKCCGGGHEQHYSSRSSQKSSRYSCCCCYPCRHQGPEANALAQYPHSGSRSTSSRNGGDRNANRAEKAGDYEHSSTPSPRSKKLYYDTVTTQPSV